MYGDFLFLDMRTQIAMRMRIKPLEKESLLYWHAFNHTITDTIRLILYFSFLLFITLAFHDKCGSCFRCYGVGYF